MGDRAAIYIEQNDRNDCIAIYAHWSGVNILKELPHALYVARNRYSDISYFNRIIIHNILDSISSKGDDCRAGVDCVPNKDGKIYYCYSLDNPEIIISPDERIVSILDKEWTFEYIINNGDAFINEVDEMFYGWTGNENED